MHVYPALRHVLAVLLAVCSALAFAQPQKAPAAYVPSEGQEGKDVVWVPTSQALVDKMLDMARMTPRDFVMDLGSGDGRTVITAAKRGARALGVEYNPDMVALSRKNAQREGVTARATFMKADLFETDFSKATVITMFLLPEINLKLRPKILGLKPGTRVVSNTFTMGEWIADETAELGDAAGCTASWCTALLWIVPADVAGTYSTRQGELVLQQEFQMLSGTLRTEGKTLALKGKVRGEEISFRAGGHEYRGRLNGGTLDLR
jgi:SAM-dependent methyltransferase